MAKRKLRTIVVNGDIYFWRFNPGPYRPETHKFEDTFKAWLPSQSRHQLEIRFTPDDHYMFGDPLNLGAVPCIASDPQSGGVNLHEPAWAATLIRCGIERGWRPEEATLIVDDGMALLAELHYKPN